MPTLLAGPGGMPLGLGLNEGLGVSAAECAVRASLAYPQVSLYLSLAYSQGSHLELICMAGPMGNRTKLLDSIRTATLFASTSTRRRRGCPKMNLSTNLTWTPSMLLVRRYRAHFFSTCSKFYRSQNVRLSTQKALFIRR